MVVFRNCTIHFTIITKYNTPSLLLRCAKGYDRSGLCWCGVPGFTVIGSCRRCLATSTVWRHGVGGGQACHSAALVFGGVTSEDLHPLLLSALPTMKDLTCVVLGLSRMADCSAGGKEGDKEKSQQWHRSCALFPLLEVASTYSFLPTPPELVYRGETISLIGGGAMGIMTFIGALVWYLALRLCWLSCHAVGV